MKLVHIAYIFIYKFRRKLEFVNVMSYDRRKSLLLEEESVESKNWGSVMISIFEWDRQRDGQADSQTSWDAMHLKRFNHCCWWLNNMYKQNFWKWKSIRKRRLVFKCQILTNWMRWDKTCQDVTLKFRQWILDFELTITMHQKSFIISKVSPLFNPPLICDCKSLCDNELLNLPD